MTMTDDIRQYIDRNIVQWMDDTIGEACRTFALINGLPNKILSKIETKKLGYMEAHVENNYEITSSKGQLLPLGKMLNSGWGQGGYTIEGNPILHWIDPITLEDRFATKVRHPGFDGYHFMEAGKKLGMRFFIDKISLGIATIRNWETGIAP